MQMCTPVRLTLGPRCRQLLRTDRAGVARERRQRGEPLGAAARAVAERAQLARSYTPICLSHREVLESKCTISLTMNAVRHCLECRLLLLRTEGAPRDGSAEHMREAMRTHKIGVCLRVRTM